MSLAKLDPATLKRSRLADRSAPAGVSGLAQEKSIVRMETSEVQSQAWRITFPRLDREDSRPPLVRGIAPNNSTPVFNAQLFGYAAGHQNTPQALPFRDAGIAANPVPGDVDPFFVEIAWGQDQGNVARMLGNWPALGGSLNVYGSYVEVFAGVFINAAVPQAEMPIFSAFITPAEGLAVADSSELSLVQTRATVVDDPEQSAVFYVPDFARRVQVILVDNVTGRVPTTGHPRTWFDWFDDRQNLIASWMQGTTIGTPPEWVPVPARATLLRVMTPGANLDCGEVAFTTALARAHWRIAP